MSEQPGPYMHPNQTPEELKDNARRMGERRWLGVSPEERSEILRRAISHREYHPDPLKPRCPCGAMTMKRALARADTRGTSLGHQPGCTFYRRRRRPGARGPGAGAK